MSEAWVLHGVKNYPLFGLKIDDDDEADPRTRKQEKNALLWEAWGRYTRIEKVTVSCAADIVAFWESQDPILADAIMPYLRFPITTAYIERIFSLAGLIDAKNLQKMSSSLCKAAVGMYCNGDVECRFIEP